MGRLNIVNLYGRIPCKVELRADSHTGEPKIAKVPIQVSRRKYAREDMTLGGRILMSTPVVMSRDREIMKVMAELIPGDFVFVKGNLCTREINKKFVCPEEECGYVHIKGESVMVYIDPVFVKKVEHIEDKGEGEKKVMLELTEISNQVIIDGRLCRDVEYYENGKTRVCSYQIAANRLRKIAQDETFRDTDFPWIKSFGKVAESDGIALHKNSVITVNGAIQTRVILESCMCPNCKKEFVRKGMATEIVPYSVEYRENCTLPESTHISAEDEGESYEKEE